MDTPPPVLVNQPPPTLALDRTLTQDQYVLKRKLLKLIGGQFNIYDGSGAQVLQANQKGFKLKEEITVCGGPDFKQALFGIYARQVIDLGATYDVRDLQTNAPIGSFRRKGFNSLVRDEWAVFDANGTQVGIVIEDSLALALVRRLLTNLVPQNYDLVIGDRRYVDLKQNFNPFTYHLNVIFEVPPQQFDRRLGLAAAILLAAIEGRQRG